MDLIRWLLGMKPVAWDGKEFHEHECIFCKRDPDASYCVPESLAQVV